jgi:hypothetical protein
VGRFGRETRGVMGRIEGEASGRRAAERGMRSFKGGREMARGENDEGGAVRRERPRPRWECGESDDYGCESSHASRS